MKLTTKQKDLLQWAGMGCGCEPYYKFTCAQCRSIGKGFGIKNAKAIKTLIDMGLIERNESIGSYKLTRAGWLAL